MSPAQIVFLFDLNACADYCLRSKEELTKNLLSVRLASLRLLRDFSVKCSSLKWGVKFFDSCGSKTQLMNKFAFHDLSLENFETLENEICSRYERHMSMLQALSESSQSNGATSIADKYKREINNDPPVKILQLALTQILCEFQWETMEMWSPSYSKTRNRKKNFIFVFSDFSDCDEILFKYFGINSIQPRTKFQNLFLPQSLRDSLFKKADIHLVLLNMCQNQKFMGTFSSKLLPLLSETLHSFHSSLIPLCILSQPVYDLKILKNVENSLNQEKTSIASLLPIGFQNSFLPFSTIFKQSLYQPFYSNSETLAYEGCICFTMHNLQIPIKMIEISKRKSILRENAKKNTAGSSKSQCTQSDEFLWSKFIVHCAVPEATHCPTGKIFLCLSSHNEGSLGDLQKLTKNLSLNHYNMLLECVTSSGLKVPGFLIPLSSDAAIISVLDPTVYSLKLGSSCKTPDSLNSRTKNLDCDASVIIKNNSLNGAEHVTTSDNTRLKNFEIDCLESRFKSRSLPNLASFIESKSSHNPEKLKTYQKLFKRSATSDNSSKSKSERQLNEESATSSDAQTKENEELPDDQAAADCADNLEELASDLTHAELLSAIREVYNSAIDVSGNIISASKRIMKMMVGYCKKNSEPSFEEAVSSMFKENFLMTDKKINEKYGMAESEGSNDSKIKECQIQILLILEVESLKLSPDKSHCAKSIISLLRIATFCYSQKELLQLEGEKELKIFMDDVLKKNYSHNLHDILVEVNDEVFDDWGSTPSSPAETVSSEFNIDEDLFSSVVSNMSERSSSSICSQKEKDALGRKLCRRRSDISDTMRCRQVILSKSSPKKKKAKIITNKAIRYSPRLAAKKEDKPTKSTDEKSNKVRRNLFAGDRTCRTPKKHNHLSTPKNKKKQYTSKLAAETPTYKQNSSALQRRKSFIDPSSSSPKVIAESPKIIKSAKGNVNKELLEKLQKASQAAVKSADIAASQKPVPSFKDYTPESKRRLSLKLFSKLLSSPTARQGIKKCTKRLFEQTSPQKTHESSKRQKLDDGCEGASSSFTKKKTQS